MSDRHNGYGKSLSSSAVSTLHTLASTRRVASQQPPAKQFSSAPPTRQWTCACGYINPAIRATCGGCGETGGAR